MATPEDPATSPPRVRVLVAEATAVAVGTVALVALHLRLWRATWSVPWVADGDATFYLMVVRALGDGRGYLVNDQLGFPFGQRLHDLPQGVDHANWLVLRVLAALTESPGSAVNAFYVLSFATVAAVAHVAFRLMGVRRATAAVGALLYAVAPFHFARNEVHLLLGSYALVPVAVLLVLGVLGLEERPRWREARTAWACAAMAGLASTGAYYLAFTLLLLTLAGVTAAVVRRRWMPLGAAAVLVAVGAVVFALNVAPTLVELATGGANPGVAVRTPGETELYGLRISQLYSPRLDHRIGPLADLAAEARGDVVPSENGQQLGLVAAVGLSVVVVALLLAAAGARVAALERRLGLIAVASVLVASVSGFSYLISAVGIREIRSWNRISILLAFVGLLATLRLLERGLTRLATRVGRPAGPVVLAGAVMVGLLGWFDQTSPADVPAYAAAEARWSTDAAFFAAVRGRVGDGAALLFAPHLPFPEVPNRGGVGPYDGAIGYVHEPSLRWTWGFMRGRHPEWPCALAAAPPDEQARRARAVGLSGVVVDRRGDRTPGEVEAPWRTALGPPVLESADGRYALFDLRAVAVGDDASVVAAATLALEPAAGIDACYGT